jgi:hypothetical protein
LIGRPPSAGTRRGRSTGDGRCAPRRGIRTITRGSGTCAHSVAGRGSSGCGGVSLHPTLAPPRAPAGPAAWHSLGASRGGARHRGG